MRAVAAALFASLTVGTPVAFADDPTVHLPGLGMVPLADASETCLENRPVGAVAGLTDPSRKAAFQALAEGLLALPEEGRRAYFRYQNDLLWPQGEADARYVGTIAWVPTGIVPSCYAVGLHWVQEGLRRSAVCATSRSACKEAFERDEWSVVKEALKADRTGPRDGFFAVLHDAGSLTTYRNPAPFLAAACEYPRKAAKEGRFIDLNDLWAARWACEQQLLLIERRSMAPLDFLGCSTPWADITKDVSWIVEARHTDLGLSDRYRNDQVTTLQDRLKRMDPSAATCEAPWAMDWRRELVHTWRETQTKRACGDAELHLDDRAQLCPDLLDQQTGACREGAAQACHVLARMHLEGVQTPTDERAGLDLMATACAGGDEPACQSLPTYTIVIDRWFTDSLAAARPVDPRTLVDPNAELPPAPPPDGEEPAWVIPEGAPEALKAAHTLVDHFGPPLGDTWHRARTKLLFEAALVAEQSELAKAVLDNRSNLMDPSWMNDALLRLEELKVLLADRALAAEEPG